MVRIVCDAVNAVVAGADDSVKKLIQDMLSYQVDGGPSGGWAGTSTMFAWSTNSFPAGFARSVAAGLNKKGVKCTFMRKPMVQPAGKENPVVNPFPYNPDYAYQDLAVERMVTFGSIIAQIATGGGKSAVACKAVARVNRRTLFLTTRAVLMHQMAGNFQTSLDYRAASGEPHLVKSKIGVIGDGQVEFSEYINVGTVQTIASHLSEPDPTAPKAKQNEQAARREKMKAFLASITLLILEEAHESSGNNFSDITRMCRNADYRIALTATPFMKDSTEANMRLMAVSGRIEIKVTEEYLINRGILAKPFFRYCHTRYEPDLPRLEAEQSTTLLSFKLGPRASYPVAYKLGITYNLARNRMIVQTALDYKNNKLTCMCLVRIERHGQILAQMMTEAGVRCTFINGKSSQQKRQQQLKMLAAGEIDVLIGSTIVDVGVDVPAVGALIFAGGGKAEVELRQRIGRGLRAKKDTANVCFVTDFIDQFHRNLLSHSMERKNIVQSTAGFAEGILPLNYNFDYDKILGIKK